MLKDCNHITSYEAYGEFITVHRDKLKLSFDKMEQGMDSTDDFT